MGNKFGFEELASALRLQEDLLLTSVPQPVLVGLEKVGGDGLKNLGAWAAEGV